MKHWTIQLRLAGWYFASVAVIVAIFATGSWIAMKASLYHAIDRDLRRGIEVVVPFIDQHSLNNIGRFGSAFADSSNSSIVGVFVQITNDQGELLYESDVLRKHGIPLFAPRKPGEPISIETVGNSGWPLRVLNQHIVVAGVGLNLHIVEPLHDVLASLREYTFYICLLITVALLLATAVGRWLSRRALLPVEQIRKEAQAVDPRNLSARLPVPAGDDELSRLAQTLNAMLSRIETGFHSVQQFTADASHELRAPLSLITTAAEVSLRRERSREEISEAMDKILREARHMSQLVENLLVLARGDTIQGAPSSSSDLALILRELGAELAPLIHAKGLALTRHIPDQQIFVVGGEVDLRRLFMILMDNAIKYTEVGSIRLTVVASAQGVGVIVQDTGIGIAPSDLPYVFDRFWRADKVRSRAEGGTGLGLSLAQQIVLRHGGHVSVESELGRGSTFTVRLKLV